MTLRNHLFADVEELFMLYFVLGTACIWSQGHDEHVRYFAMLFVDNVALYIYEQNGVAINLICAQM